MASYHTDEWKHEHKNKADRMADKFKLTMPELHRIEFRANNRFHAVLLTDEQLARAQKAAKKAGLTLNSHYIKKYSNAVDLKKICIPEE